nr:TPA_asm: ND4 [Baikalogammarus pullus]
MLSVGVGVFSGVVFSRAWGENLLWGLMLSGVLAMSSSDSLNWKSSLLGELDYMGWGLSLLSVWIITLALLGSNSVKESSSYRFLFVCLMVSLMSALVVSFYVSDFLYFYVSFEVCLVPIFFLILGWGYQPERSQAGIYMLFYTLFGSLPFFFLVMESTSYGLSYMHKVDTEGSLSVFFYFMLVAAFLVKLPMYSVHLWLLKAHVEAPVAGSMILAGVLLKLGGYGLARVLPFWGGSASIIGESIVCISLWGGFVVSLSCLRQMDMKVLIASSSVVHMSMCVGGLFVMSEWGLKGAVLVMISHGLCSSGLFYLANVAYLRTSSRSMVISKGLLSLMPSMSLLWFLLVSANMAAPPTMNLFSEILLISSIVSWSLCSMAIIGLLSFFSAGYSLYLFSLSQHGVFLGSKSGCQSGSVVEYLVCTAHWAPLNMVILCVSLLI